MFKKLNIGTLKNLFKSISKSEISGRDGVRGQLKGVGGLSPTYNWHWPGGDNRKRGRSAQRRVGPQARPTAGAPAPGSPVRASFPQCVRYPPINIYIKTFYQVLKNRMFSKLSPAVEWQSSTKYSSIKLVALVLIWKLLTKSLHRGVRTTPESTARIIFFGT